MPSRVGRGSAAALLPGLQVRISPGPGMCDLCVLCVESLTSPRRSPDESYRLWCVTVCDLEI